jgi:hypothetical protein
VSLPGHRARLLAHLEEASIERTWEINPHRLKAAPDPEPIALAQIEDWLSSMNLSEHLHNFINTGYDDLEELHYLTMSNYPITDAILQEIGLTKPGYRNRILINLQSAVQLETSRERTNLK